MFELKYMIKQALETIKVKRMELQLLLKNEETRLITMRSKPDYVEAFLL